jgi:hypothetical protein
LPWKERDEKDPGSWEVGGFDKRNLVTRTNGVGFVHSGWGGEFPEANDWYVKLCPFSGAAQDGAANALLVGDPAARFRGVDAAEIYISKPIMERLARGKYPFNDMANSVALRNAAGEVQYVRPAPWMREKEFWINAYQNGVTPTEWKTTRWRSVQDLVLCFVVNGARTTVEDLDEVVREVRSYATVPIKETAVVTTFAQKPNAFNRLVSPDEPRCPSSLSLAAPIGLTRHGWKRQLGRSPFGDYDTWIREIDYAGYILMYPGYALPTQDEVTEMGNTVDGMLAARTARVTKQDNTFANELRDANDADESRNVGVVSYETIARALVPGARRQAPTQRTQMGGSATRIAEAVHWDHATERIPGTAVWSSPGVYPAEWLHRSAFSWGNAVDARYAQASSNLIFGSSEANSRMTRYEKAWQLLFSKERRLGKELLRGPGAVRRLQAYQGTLVTINTPAEEPIVTTSRDLGGHVHTLRVHNNGAAPPTAEDEAQGHPVPGEWANYWAAARDHRNLSWSLKYQLTLSSNTGLLGVTSPPSQWFFSFERGFYTRLEAEVDVLLLNAWEDQARARLQQPLPPVAQPEPMAAERLYHPLAMLSINPSSAAPPPQQQEDRVADAWRQARRGEHVSVGGIPLRSPRAATLDAAGRMVHLPLAPHDTAHVALAPLPATSAVGAATGDRAPSEPTDATVSVPTETAPPAGFVLAGTVKLFGLFDAPMYACYGSAADGLRQIVPIEAGLADSISALVPSLADSDYGTAVRLKNTELVYNELTTAAAMAGTWIQTDVVFSGPLQPVSDCLKDVFHQADPLVRVQALLTPKNNWAEPIPVAELGLCGTLPGIDLRVGDVLHIRQLGVNVGLKSSRQPWPPYKAVWEHSLGFSGALEIEMPQNMAPLLADFSMVATAGMLTLVATVREGDDTPTVSPQAFAGVEGLKLSAVALQTTLGIGAAASSATGCTANAELKLRDWALQLWGYYNKRDWGFTCDIDGDFSFDDLRAMYEDLFGAPLHLTSHDVVLDDLSFVAHPSGLTLAARVTIEGHTAANATIAISRHGLEIKGDVADVVLESDIILKSASLDVFVGRQDDTEVDGPGTSFRFAIKGVVGVADGAISASMFLDKDSSRQTLWTITGSFEGAFSLSRIAPGLHGTFLDLTVQEAMFIASNIDGTTAAGAAVPAAYPVIKGVQIAGTLEPIPALDSALGVSSSKGTEVTGLTLQALYSAASSSFELAIQLPSARKMSMKGGTVYSGPISLLIQVSESPTIALNADFFVRVPNQAEPLRFSGGLAASSSEAKLFIELTNQWWQNPFGLSPQLKLGPTLALEVGIVYAGPVYPSEIGVAAGLAVGDVSGTAALSISDMPTNELVMLHIENLGIKDLVSFAGLLLETSLPTPEDFLRFKHLDFYLSSGTTIGTVVYPPGASFSCDAILFGHEATVACSVSKAQKQIAVSGSLQAIDVGPISVSGYERGTPARLDVQFGAQQQSVAIDGGVNIFDLDARMLVKVDVMPTPSFQLQTELDFTAHLTFQLQAMMRPGATGGTAAGLQGLDFDVHAVFQQDLLDWVAAQIDAQTLAAKKAIDDGEEAAQHSLDQAEAEYRAAINAAQKQVDAAKATYETKLNTATAALSAEQQRAEQQRQELATTVDHAVQAFNAAVEAAQRSIQEAEDERARQMQAAEQQVQDAKEAANRDIDSHLRDLNNARDDMNQRFGDAIAKIQSAKNNANSLQGQVDDAQRALDDAQRDLGNAQAFDKIGKVGIFTSLHSEKRKTERKRGR